MTIYRLSTAIVYSTAYRLPIWIAYKISYKHSLYFGIPGVREAKRLRVAQEVRRIGSYTATLV